MLSLLLFNCFTGHKYNSTNYPATTVRPHVTENPEPLGPVVGGINPVNPRLRERVLVLDVETVARPERAF